MLKTRIVKKQEELDAVHKNSHTHIIVEFGTAENPAIIKEKLKFPVEVRKGVAKAYGCAEVWVCYDSTLICFDDVKVNAYDKTNVIAYNRCTIQAYDNSNIKGYNECKIFAHDYSRAFAYNECSVVAYNQSVVNVFNKSSAWAFNDCGVIARDVAAAYLYDSCKYIAVGKNTVAEREKEVWSRKGKKIDKKLLTIKK